MRIRKEDIKIMIDIYNKKLEKFADGERHIFTATFVRPSARLAIFQDLKVDNQESKPVVDRIAIHYTKTFKDLNLHKGDVVQFEGIVKKDKKNEFMVERPTKAETISSVASEDEKNGVHVVSDDWNWFEK